MPNIFMASLGCAKNLVDAETYLGETLDDEFSLAIEPENADVIVVNTCGFIEDARREARQIIGEYLDLKRSARRPVKVVAIGCWAQRAPGDIRREFPDLDAIWGLDIASSLGDRLRSLLAGHDQVAGPCGPPVLREGARLLTTLPSYAYLRLSDGCDNRCHYCAIPLIRGGLRSRKPDAVLDEARLLADQGARELILISQDTTAYGHDLGDPSISLATLLERLLRAVDTPRLRVLYAHPAHLDDNVVRLLRDEPRLCRYLDLPVQHVADSVLARMNRGYGGDRIRQIVNAFTGRDFTLRTTMLTGFPGETEAEFAEMLALVKSGCFRHLGAFAYSPEPGTPAFDMPDRVPQEVAEERRDAILAAQAANAFAWLDSRIGGTEAVLVDSRADDEWLVGRTVHEAPDADGAVYLRSRKRHPGDVVLACIKGRDGYDLLAEAPAGAPAGKPRRGKRRR